MTVPRPVNNFKKVYVGMCCDLIHHGHIRIIKAAAAYGVVTVGLLSDAAISTYKKPPILIYESRKEVVESIRWVDKVVPQYTLSYRDNLLMICPDYVVHADDWKEGPQAQTRYEVIKTISQWNGKLI